MTEENYVVKKKRYLKVIKRQIYIVDEYIFLNSVFWKYQLILLESISSIQDIEFNILERATLSHDKPSNVPCVGHCPPTISFYLFIYLNLYLPLV